MSHCEKLSRKQESAVVALLTEPTIVAAAQMVGVSEKTLDRWLADPTFAATYRAARKKVFDQAVNTLRAASTEAVQTLRDALSDVSSSIRLRAALGILDFGIKITEMTDIEERLTALERRAQDGNGKPV